MNFNLKNIPKRTKKARDEGITMVIDKGSSIQQCKDLIESSSKYIDFVKFGWTTSNFTEDLKKKIKLFNDADIHVYFGGTLFEAFAIRDQFEDYINILKEYNLKYAEVSDGSISITHKRKCEYIEKLSKHVTVLSEVGSKDEKKIIPPYKWIRQMRQGLVEEILTEIPKEKIIWEAPLKAQQVWFVKLLGQNVNLGNISGNEVISVETIRVGLRGDTFNEFL